MNVKTISTMLCECMNDICHVDNVENQTIQYGMELSYYRKLRKLMGDTK